MTNGRTDWSKLKAMSDEEAQHNALADPDAQPATDAMWSTGRWVYLPSGRIKQQLSLRLDAEVVDYFKGTGKGYQSRINAILRHYVDAQRQDRP